MNPVFIILVLLAAVALWFLLSFLFRPLGNLFFKLWENTMDEINKNEDEEKEND